MAANLIRQPEDVIERHRRRLDKLLVRYNSWAVLKDSTAYRIVDIDQEKRISRSTRVVTRMYALQPTEACITANEYLPFDKMLSYLRHNVYGKNIS